MRQARSGHRGTVVVVSEPQAKRAYSVLKPQLASPLAKWQEEQLKAWLEGKRAEEVFTLTLRDGPVWLLKVTETAESLNESGGIKAGQDPLAKSLFAKVRDAAGAVVQGDPTHPRVVSDLWTFERRLGDANPNWTLVATGD